MRPRPLSVWRFERFQIRRRISLWQRNLEHLNWWDCRGLWVLRRVLTSGSIHSRNMEGQSFETRIFYHDCRENWNRNGNDIPHSKRPCRGPFDRGDQMSISLLVLEIWGSKTPSKSIILDCGIRNSFKLYRSTRLLSPTIACANTFPWIHILWSCSSPKLTLSFRKTAKTAC